MIGWWIGLVLAADAPLAAVGRFAVASELLLPRPVRFATDAGQAFETRSWQVRAEVSCAPTDAKRPTLRCVVGAAELVASAFDGSAPGDVAAALRVHADALVGYTIDSEVDARGRRRRWDSVGRPSGSATLTARGWLLELTVERAIAGLFVDAPPADAAIGRQWVETSRSAVFSYPRLDGNFPIGTAVVLHQLTASEGRRQVADCVGDGTLVDEGEQLKQAGRCRTVWEGGLLQDRTWSIDGTNLDTVRYHHAGWLRRLTPEERVDLGATQRVSGPGEAPGAWPAWPDL